MKTNFSNFKTKEDILCFYLKNLKKLIAISFLIKFYLLISKLSNKLEKAKIINVKTTNKKRGQSLKNLTKKMIKLNHYYLQLFCKIKVYPSLVLLKLRNFELFCKIFYFNQSA